MACEWLALSQTSLFGILGSIIRVSEALPGRVRGRLPSWRQTAYCVLCVHMQGFSVPVMSCSLCLSSKFCSSDICFSCPPVLTPTSLYFRSWAEVLILLWQALLTDQKGRGKKEKSQYFTLFWNFYTYTSVFQPLTPSCYLQQPDGDWVSTVRWHWCVYWFTWISTDGKTESASVFSRFRIY